MAWLRAMAMGFENALFSFGGELGDEARDVGRVVLQIAIEGRDDLAARRVDAGLHGGGLAVVAGEAQHPHMRAEVGSLGD